jgi:hypothetical protein
VSGAQLLAAPADNLFEPSATEKAMTTLTLTADETDRFWKFNEEAFRATVTTRAAQKAKALGLSSCAIVGDDGIVLGTVTA